MDPDDKFLFDANIIKAHSEQSVFKVIFGQPIDDISRKRGQVFLELCLTEITFLLQLEILLKFFYYPLKSGPILPQASFELLFGNIMQLYNVNRELLGAMQSKRENIAEEFITFAPYLKLYSIYAYSYKNALAALEELQNKNKKFNEFVRNQETRPEVGCTIISLLIAPIQRVPRYRLLFQSLLESTPTDHPQRAKTQEALALIEDTADHINRLITESEEGEEIIKLARRFGPDGSNLVVPGRKIVKEGVVRKSAKNGIYSQQRYLVLFTDAILIARGGTKGPLSVSRLLPLRHVAVETVLGSSLFQISCQDEKILLYTAVPADGVYWTQAIENAIKNHALCRRTLRKDSSKRNVGCRRLKGVAQRILKRARSFNVDSKSPRLVRLKRLRRQ